MPDIDIVIPTLHRPEKLKKCIESIELAVSHVPSNFVEVFIYYSDRKDFLHSLVVHMGKENFYITPKLVENYKASTFWNDHLRISRAGTMMYLNDDVILDEFCIIQAYKTMTREFYGLDGVIGLNQQNIPKEQAVKAAFGMIGTKFADRFPDRKVFCEDYNRFFLDKELEDYATSTKSFCFAETAKLTHLHPAFDSKQEDATHVDVRTHLNRDKNMYDNRQSKGYLWGKTYDRLTV